jgi:glutamate-1-semialdehyde aminotransferase
MTTLTTQPPTRSQTDYLASLIERYTDRTAASKQLAQDNRLVLADKTSIGFNFSLETKEICYPLVIDRAAGSKLWDIDGNEYTDILMGLGTSLCGHNPPFVQAAIAEQLAQGVHLGTQTALAGEVAHLIRDLTGAERVTFSNTGTEAVMTAVRVARAATQRSKIAMFTNSYHGHFDAVLGRAKLSEYARKKAKRILDQKTNGNSILKTLATPLQALLNAIFDPGAVPAAIGIPPCAVRDVLILEYGNPKSLDLIRSHRHQLAAVLVEPVQSRCPELQPQEFLQQLRSLTQQHKIALIFDEMVTGFRVHPGGAQAHFGVQADLVTYSKIVGGGLPLSVIAGKADYLNYIDGGFWQYGDRSTPTTPTTFFAGTFCKHPLSLAAARAMLTHLKTEGDDLQATLNQRTAELVANLNQAMTAHSIPIRFTAFGSFFAIALSQSTIPDLALALLSYHLLEQGIHLRQGDRGGFLSTTHTTADIDQIQQAFITSIHSLKAAGFLD